MPRIYRNLSGRQGWVRIPALGSKIGEAASWTARPCSNEGAEAEFDDVTVIFHWIQPELYLDPEYEKVIELQVNKQNVFAVDLGPSRKSELAGRVLTLERVRLVRDE